MFFNIEIMIDNLSIAEEKINEYLSVLKSIYPEESSTPYTFQDLKRTYESIPFGDNLIVVLFDHRTSSMFYVSENIATISGYTQKTILKWGGLVLFKALDYSHYSFLYAILKMKKNFDDRISLGNKAAIQFFCCGLKFVDRHKKIKRGVFRSKPLLFDKNGQVSVSAFFGEEISHLLKGEHYWMRVQCQNESLAYVQQKGKKVFQDILSNREKEILKLVMKKKTNQEIAEIVHLSKFTVETHRKNMIKRIGAIDSTAMLHLCKMTCVL